MTLRVTFFKHHLEIAQEDHERWDLKADDIHLKHTGHISFFLFFSSSLNRVGKFLKIFYGFNNSTPFPLTTLFLHVSPSVHYFNTINAKPKSYKELFVTRITVLKFVDSIQNLSLQFYLNKIFSQNTILRLGNETESSSEILKWTFPPKDNY